MEDVGELEVRWAQGFTKQRVEFIDKDTVCYVSGNFIVFLNTETEEIRVLQGPGRGVGALAANGRGILAFSEHKLKPSIYVYNYPQLGLKNELKGTAQLDYTSLALSDSGPYLACYASFPDHTITLWNWENAERICSQPQSGKDVISLVFNPMNWLQICALGSASLTVWNIEKSDGFHIMQKSMIDLPGSDGSTVDKEVTPSHTVNDRLTYMGPQMPVSAISGLMGDNADDFVPQCCTRARVTPTALCWTTSSQLYVGCKEGFLLLVDPASPCASVLFNPTAVDAIPELRNSCFESLVLHRDGLIVAGKENVIHRLHVQGVQMEISQTWELEEPAAMLKYSPDYETLLLASNKGRIYRYKPTQLDKVVKVLDVLNGNFVAGASLHTADDNVCVSVRDSGELQLWSTDGSCIGSLDIQAKVTSVACCPVAQYTAVGTASGHVLFIDLIRKEHPRLVHKVHLYNRPVDQLLFDQGGNYLFTGASDARVFLLDPKPSKTFSVIGYTVVAGSILQLSTQYVRDSKQVKVLALCTGQKDKVHEGSLVTVLTLPVKDLTGPGCIDRWGCLSNDILQGSTYKVTPALQSCVLGVNEFFGYCHQRKTLQKFILPQDIGPLSSHREVQLRPAQEVKGHPLGPASLVLSPHLSWLASGGRDGLLRVWETTSLERYVEVQCHSRRLGGIRRVSFSADGQTLLTAGGADGSLVCTKLRIKASGVCKGDKATQSSQALFHLLESDVKAENSVLSQLSTLFTSAHTQQRQAHDRPESVEVTDQEPSDPTWLERQQQEVAKAESLQYSPIKEDLRKNIKELRDTVQALMRENEELPDTERLELQEFNLDVEEQRRMEAQAHQEVTQVRNEIKLENLAKHYLHDLLKRESWDSMKVKGKAVKAFHSEDEVKNYPMMERTQEELDELFRVQSIRKTEMADSIRQREQTMENIQRQQEQTMENIQRQQKQTVEKKSGAVGEKEDEERQEEEGQEAENAALSGSLSAHLGCSNPYLYHQFNLHFREQKINQITLLQDVIYQVKTAFNGEFEAVYKRKHQEVSRVMDKNRRVREIMADLDLQGVLWEPGLADSEQPQRMLTVADSEITVERYLTAEQREKEDLRKAEEQRRLADMADNIRETALGGMMGGVLEVKKEDVLRMDIPKPQFILDKPDIQWSEEEKKISKEYEKKSKELSEEKEKYRKILESEMKKLQGSIKDATQGFDETLRKLFERKVKSEMVICQEELKIANLVYSILTEEEINNREAELGLKLEKKTACKHETGEELEKHKHEVEMFRESYDNVVAEDKLLDKGFRKEFFDLPGHVVDHLYKLYKRRPRMQKRSPQADNNDDNNNNPYRDGPAFGWSADEELGQTLKGMRDLDAAENMPEGLDPSIWERFCLLRTAKVQCEHQVKMKALTLVEMQAFLQKRIDDDDAVKQQIKMLTDELNGLREEKIRFLLDIMVQLLMKQGQVEVPATGDIITHYADTVLQHRSVVEDLNGKVRTLGEQKIASMVRCKDFRKGIIQQEWDHQRLRMHIEDLNTKAKDIQMLRLDEELQEYLTETDHHNRMSKQVSTLEKRIALQEQTHLKNVEHHKKTIKQLNRQAALKAEKNYILDQQLADMQVTVAERRHIYEAIAMEDKQSVNTEARYQDIVQRRRLMEISVVQAEELALLRAEVERLRMRSFPALDNLKHT